MIEVQGFRIGIKNLRLRTEHLGYRTILGTSELWTDQIQNLKRVKTVKTSVEQYFKILSFQSILNT